MNKNIKIAKSTISRDSKTYIVAEMSGNHNGHINRAKEIIKEVARTGADAIKLQTYTADTITIDCDSDIFMTGDGLWQGRTLYDLYQEAHTPWEWQGELQDYALSLGLDFFSSPFDLTAIDFLEKLKVPAYKVASFEINDIPFLRKIARTGKPIIISTGIAYLSDIELAIKTCKSEGNENVILLKCTSEYPAPFEDMNLNTIKNMSDTFDCLVGLSDHTLGTETAIASVALGASMVEKHFTLSRSEGGVDSAFSMEPDEFAKMIEQIRNVEKALGKVTYSLTDAQIDSRKYARSLFVVEDVKKGEVFTEKNIRSIRPNAGMPTKYYDKVLGKRASKDIAKGTPLKRDLII